MSDGRVLCPQCGIPMNRHAAKIVEPRSAEEAERLVENLGGTVAEVHACASCGGVQSRRRRGEPSSAR